MKILDYAPWITKGSIILGIVLGGNGKKPVPMTRRELPLAVTAIALSAVSDYFVVEWVWNQHEQDVVKLTGFKNGIFISPDRMKAMRSKVMLSPSLPDD